MSSYLAMPEHLNHHATSALPDAPVIDDPQPSVAFVSVRALGAGLLRRVAHTEIRLADRIDPWCNRRSRRAAPAVTIVVSRPLS